MASHYTYFEESMKCEIQNLDDGLIVLYPEDDKDQIFLQKLASTDQLVGIWCPNHPEIERAVARLESVNQTAVLRFPFAG